MSQNRARSREREEVPTPMCRIRRGGFRSSKAGVKAESRGDELESHSKPAASRGSEVKRVSQYDALWYESPALMAAAEGQVKDNAKW